MHRSCQWSSLMQSLDKPIDASSIMHFHSTTLTIGCVMAATSCSQVTAATILTGIDPDHRLQCFKCDPAGYFVGFRATSVGQMQQEVMNHPEKNDDPAGASGALSRGKIDAEVMSTLHETDGKLEEVEIGIVSASEGENPKTRGFWRVTSVAEVEHHLSACAEKD
ncbi:20S proteasome subunit [Pisolithus sp. B1]|nr:20S proteasome subunit [Pisolithus sp. B1]